MQEQNDKKTQGLAMGLVLIAAVVAVGGYFYTSGAFMPKQRQVDTSCPTSQVTMMIDVELTQGRATAADGSPAARVVTVESEGVAGKAGVQAGDFITACDDKPITCPKDVMQYLKEGWSNGEVTLKIEREGKPLEVKLDTSEPFDSESHQH